MIREGPKSLTKAVPGTHLQRERNLPWDCFPLLQTDSFYLVGRDPGFGVLWIPSNGGRGGHTAAIRGSLYPWDAMRG